MNTETDYTLCNLDSPHYSNVYNGNEIPATLYGYSSINNNRSLDTGQQGYYGAENTLPHGNCMDLTLGNTGHNQHHSSISYSINTSPMMGRTGRTPVYHDITEGQLTHCMDPYTGLAVNGDTTGLHHGGIPPLSPGDGRAMYASPCVENHVPCSISNGTHNAYIPQNASPSPVKSESPSPQSLQAKPFRWMQIKRNPTKTSKYFTSM
ncbi:hypothetical protein ACJMK2_021516 [Sinanodonta woodiana]|uniref:Uncharacterized protein n=1 Tax=Sinanodonta woodiana TaxID=1069815 RepID=A0ABD3THU8_SINWO